ncbi:MAG: DNA gyrase subunit A [Mycobacteriales bacterium]
MSERTGLSDMELAVLFAADGAGDGQYRRSVDVLADLHAATGLGPAHAYPLLVDLAVPWKLLDPLIDTNGNFGTPGNDPPAHPRYTECRPSRLGQLALAVERGDVAPLPIGLAIGTLHAGGSRPPLPAPAVADALSALIASDGAVADEWLSDCFWPLVLPGGCEVLGDREAFESGARTTLRLRAGITREPTRRQPTSSTLVITALPYDVNPDDLMLRLAQTSRHRHVPDEFPELAALLAGSVVDVRDESSARAGMRIVVEALGEVEAEHMLRSIWGVERDLEVEFPAGPALAIRRFWAAARGADLTAAVARLRVAGAG